jgi:hypothetical protein
MAETHQDFLSEFNDERKPLLAAMLTAIHEACPDLTETIKWNAPTFSLNGKDRLTFMLHKQAVVGLILHTGAKAKEDKKAPRLYEDSSGLLVWISNIRATISFVSLDEFLVKRDLFVQAVRQWIAETGDL